MNQVNAIALVVLLSPLYVGLAFYVRGKLRDREDRRGRRDSGKIDIGR